MDNAWGALIVIGLVIAAVIWIVKMILIMIAGSFVLLTALFGHPIFVLAALAAAGAGIGMIVLNNKRGAYVARSAHDFAEIGSLKLTPEGWAALVLAAFLAALVLHGFLFGPKVAPQSALATPPAASGPA